MTINKAARAAVLPVTIIGLMMVGLAAKIERYGRDQPMSAAEAVDRTAASLVQFGWQSTGTVANGHGLELAWATLHSPSCPDGLALIAMSSAPEVVAFARRHYGDSFRLADSAPDISAAGLEIAVRPQAGSRPCHPPSDQASNVRIRP